MNRTVSSRKDYLRTEGGQLGVTPRESAGAVKQKKCRPCIPVVKTRKGKGILSWKNAGKRSDKTGHNGRKTKRL